MGNDEDLVIEDDPPVQEPEVKEPTTEEAIEALKQQLEASKKAEEAARIAAQTAQTQVHTARVEVHDTNMTLLNQALETSKQNAVVLKQNYAAALSAGDYDRAAEIQEAMSLNAAQILRIEDGKRQAEAAPPRPEPIADPVERLAAQLSDPRAKSWVRAHPEYASGAKFQELQAADQLVRARGVDVRSDAYYEQVENILGMVKQDDAPQRRAAPPAAPVNRGGSTTNMTRVRLTQEEREAARISGLSEQEYAANREAIRRSQH